MKTTSASDEVIFIIRVWQLVKTYAIAPHAANLILSTLGFTPKARQAVKAVSLGYNVHQITETLDKGGELAEDIKAAIAAPPDPKPETITAIEFVNGGQDFDWWVCDSDGLVLESIVFQSTIWAGSRITNLDGLKPGNLVTYFFKGSTAEDDESTLKYPVKSIIKSSDLAVTVLDKCKVWRFMTTPFALGGTHKFTYTECCPDEVRVYEGFTLLAFLNPSTQLWHIAEHTSGGIVAPPGKDLEAAYKQVTDDIQTADMEVMRSQVEQQRAIGKQAVYMPPDKFWASFRKPF